MRCNIFLKLKEVYDNLMKHEHCDKCLRDLETFASDEQFMSSRALKFSSFDLCWMLGIFQYIFAREETREKREAKARTASDSDFLLHPSP